MEGYSRAGRRLAVTALAKSSAAQTKAPVGRVSGWRARLVNVGGYFAAGALLSLAVVMSSALLSLKMLFARSSWSPVSTCTEMR